MAKVNSIGYDQGRANDCQRVSDVSATAIDLLVTDAKSIKLLPCWKLAYALGNGTTYRGALLPTAVIAAARTNGSMDLGK